MNLEAARQQMIDQQVRAWEVFDPAVLKVLSTVPREQFVPPAYTAVAFADLDIPLPHGQSMLAPKLVGKALQAVEPQRTDEALVVGAGTGFVVACLAHLAGRVEAIELHGDLAETARTHLAAVGLGAVLVEQGDATRLERPDRYDVIVVTASLPVYDERFQKALKVGGRLFVVVGDGPAMDAMLVRRTSERDWVRESLFETAIPALEHARRPSAFTF